MSEGPGADSAVTADSDATQPLPGFADAMIGFGNPSEVAGEPSAPPAAVATEARETPPTPEPVKQATPAPESKEEVKRDPAETPNFDGLSDDQKKTWERLYKAGFVSVEEVERARKESLFQQSWTTNNMEAAEKVKAAEARAAEVEKWKAKQEDRLLRLERILSDDRRHQAFMRASEDSFTEESVDPNQPISRAEAQRIADERYDARAKADAERTATERREYQTKKAALSKATREEQRLQGIDDATLKSILDAEEAELPSDVDPVLRYSPSELRRIIALRHRAMVAEAKVAAAEKQVRNGQSENKSKQSLAPARRVAESSAPKDAWEQAMADLNVAPDMSNVQGLGGWRNGSP